MRDIYAKLTDQIVAALEAGVQPWFKPWTGGDVSRPLRHNGEPYRGINVLMLWMTADLKGYTNHFWMTYNQAKQLGAHIRKGEKGTEVVYWSRITKQNDDGDDESFAYFKTYTVFNCQQIENLPEKYHPKTEARPAVERISGAETFFANLHMDLRHGGGSAFYNPSQDYVQMPNFEVFTTPEGYYCTLGHESTHWTRATKRLDRDLGKQRWGDEGYALEELVAELGSAYLAADLGIAATPRKDHASYIASWLKVLKGDKKAIFTAARLAERAVGYLHEQQPDYAKVEEAA
jgi:antirestriction protein ArdC